AAVGNILDGALRLLCIKFSCVLSCTALIIYPEAILGYSSGDGISEKPSTPTLGRAKRKFRSEGTRCTLLPLRVYVCLHSFCLILFKKACGGCFPALGHDAARLPSCSRRAQPSWRWQPRRRLPQVAMRLPQAKPTLSSPIFPRCSFWAWAGTNY